jgi:hypothetical protein
MTYLEVMAMMAGFSMGFASCGIAIHFLRR